jgi:hypothetical protein
VLAAGPDVISTVAGVKGTALVEEPRVAISVQAARLWFVITNGGESMRRKLLQLGNPRLDSLVDLEGRAKRPGPGRNLPMFQSNFRIGLFLGNSTAGPLTHFPDHECD